jgi:hypothetical protein
MKVSRTNMSSYVRVHTRIQCEHSTKILGIKLYLYSTEHKTDNLQLIYYTNG